MQAKQRLKEVRRRSRHERIRKHMAGNPDRLRLCLHRSLNNLNAQIIDDTTGKVLLGISTIGKKARDKIKSGGNIEGAAQLGEIVAQAAKAKGITKVCFDRGGYLYHGRVKAFAEAARKAGLEF